MKVCSKIGILSQKDNVSYVHLHVRKQTIFLSVNFVTEKRTLRYLVPRTIDTFIDKSKFKRGKFDNFNQNLKKKQFLEKLLSNFVAILKKIPKKKNAEEPRQRNFRNNFKKLRK